eukprot:tig00021017_g17222.t1
MATSTCSDSLLSRLPGVTPVDLSPQEELFFTRFPLVCVQKVCSADLGMVFCIFHPPHIMSKHFSDAEDETSTAAARACAESFGGLTFSRTSHNGLKAAYVLQSPEACAFATWLLGTSSGLELGGDDTGAYVLQGRRRDRRRGWRRGRRAPQLGGLLGTAAPGAPPRKEPPHPR